jgi:hypothetical protein
MLEVKAVSCRKIFYRFAGSASKAHASDSALGRRSQGQLKPTCSQVRTKLLVSGVEIPAIVALIQEMPHPPCAAAG